VEQNISPRDSIESNVVICIDKRRLLLTNQRREESNNIFGWPDVGGCGSFEIEALTFLPRKRLSTDDAFEQTWLFIIVRRTLLCSTLDKNKPDPDCVTAENAKIARCEMILRSRKLSVTANCLFHIYSLTNTVSNYCHTRTYQIYFGAGLPGTEVPSVFFGGRIKKSQWMA
jgi:hypothetical protein